MIYSYSSQGNQFGRVPGGGLGCLLGLTLILVLLYYAVKGLYFILWWAAPALLVLALIINWRVFPDTIKNWLSTLEARPLSGIVSALFAVFAFPFFALYLFLKALGYRKMEQMKQAMNQGQTVDDEEFVDFEEIETRPIGKMQSPEAQENIKREEPPKSQKEQNPYDGFFGGS